MEMDLDPEMEYVQERQRMVANPTLTMYPS